MGTSRCIDLLSEHSVPTKTMHGQHSSPFQLSAQITNSFRTTAGYKLYILQNVDWVENTNRRCLPVTKHTTSLVSGPERERERDWELGGGLSNDCVICTLTHDSLVLQHETEIPKHKAAFKNFNSHSAGKRAPFLASSCKALLNHAQKATNIYRTHLSLHLLFVKFGDCLYHIPSAHVELS